MRLNAWFARHAQTMVGSLGRIAQHPIAAIATMAVIAVALTLPLLLGVFLENAGAATANWNQAFDISAYLDRAAPAARAEAIAKQLRSRPDVAEVRVITAEQALSEFRAASGFGAALDALPDNPLPATLVVTPALAASTPEGTLALKQGLSGTADIQSVQIDTDWVRRLYAILDILKRVTWLTAVLLGLGVILVMGNTIRLDILNRRAEIEIMKLVGASDGFARRPFLYTAFWYGLGGGLLAIVAVTSAVLVMSGPVDRLVGLYGSEFRLRNLSAEQAGLVLASSIILCWLGSWLAATRHIRDIEPV